MSTVKKNWSLPERPTCCVCGRIVDPIAYIDCDEVHLEWDEWCGDNDHLTGCYESGPEFDWPFEENVASPDEFASIGFKVVR